MADTTYDMLFGEAEKIAGQSKLLRKRSFDEYLAKNELTYEERAQKLNEAADYQTMSGYASAASAFSGLVSSKINYDMLKTESLFQKNQADLIELQAKEQANFLRDQFSQAVGTAISQGARRGVNVGTGSIAQNIEQSSIELGKDISKEEANARAKATSLRAQADINRRVAKSGLISGIAGSIGSGLSSYGSFQQAKTLRGKI